MITLEASISSFTAISAQIDELFQQRDERQQHWRNNSADRLWEHHKPKALERGETRRERRFALTLWD